MKISDLTTATPPDATWILTITSIVTPMNWPAWWPWRPLWFLFWDLHGFIYHDLPLNPPTNRRLNPKSTEKGHRFSWQCSAGPGPGRSRGVCRGLRWLPAVFHCAELLGWRLGWQGCPGSCFCLFLLFWWCLGLYSPGSISSKIYVHIFANFASNYSNRTPNQHPTIQDVDLESYYCSC